jgi:hypothetical protein
LLAEGAYGIHRVAGPIDGLVGSNQARIMASVGQRPREVGCASAASGVGGTTLLGLGWSGEPDIWGDAGMWTLGMWTLGMWTLG